MRTTKLVAACILAGLIHQPLFAAEQLAADETKRLQALGAESFAIRWAGRVVGASERGVEAVSDGKTTLTVRPKFRSFIVHDKAATGGKDPIGFTGADGALRDTGLRMLERAGVPREEISEARVLQQFTQSGFHDAKTGVHKVDAPKKSRRTLLVSRKVADIEVISSHLTLDLDRRGGVALLQLAWPEIPDDVVAAAKALRESAGGAFKPPEMEAARPESYKVVILHSPVASFNEDIRAAIQVIYKPEKPGVGKKPVRYVDAEGRDVTLPRGADLVPEEPRERKKG